MPQDGRPAHRRTHKRLPPKSHPEEPANACNTTWQRSSGAFSGAAKKEYLKWKRQQKTARAHTSSDEGPATDHLQVPILPQLQLDAQHAVTAPGSGLETVSCQQAQRQETQLQHSAPAPLEEAMRPLQYRPLVSVPATPCFAKVPATTSASTAADSSSTRHLQCHAAAGLPRHDVHQATSMDSPMAPCLVTYMPVLDPREVGFTPEGFSLTVPTRPKWQGVVSTAEELHRMEETGFAAWQAGLRCKAGQLSGLGRTPVSQECHDAPVRLVNPAANHLDLPGTSGAAAATVTSALTQQQPVLHAHHTSHQASAAQQDLQQQQQQQQVDATPTQGLLPGLGPISQYEGRLEFWRQLWRTLEMSDLICMVVDVRNPLLHFSHALYRHISKDQKLPLLLLLNKCDLVPQAAAAAWQHWLQQQLPGVTVIPVSAAQEHAEVTAKSVLAAVLQQRVTRDDTYLSVQDYIKHSVDELYEKSVLRNTHAKSHVQKGLVRCFTGEAQDVSCRSANHVLLDAPPNNDAAQGSPLETRGLAKSHLDTSSSSSSSSDCNDDEWSSQAGRSSRRPGRRITTRKATTRRQPHLVPEPLQYPGNQAQGRDEGCKLASRLRVAATHASPEGASLKCHDPAGSDKDDQDVELALQYAADLDEQLADLTLERRLSSTSTPQRCAPAQAAAEQPCSEAAGAHPLATAPEGNASAGVPMAPAGTRRRCRPVVIGLLGEPNVGKSSMMNALLGSHRVAVSAHPGRTKHYQTHYMCDQLVLVDCPGVVCPRLDVTPALQVLFGSSPIASCREPYAAVRYLAESSWPRVQHVLKLHTHHLSLEDQQAMRVVAESEQQQGQQGQQGQQRQQGQRRQCQVARQECQKHPVLSGAGGSDAATGYADTATAAPGPASSQSNSDLWSPYTLCEALAAKRNWVLKRSGRLDTYRAANWLLRAALAGQGGIGLAYMPPGSDKCTGCDIVSSQLDNVTV